MAWFTVNFLLQLQDGKFDFFPLLSALCLESEADETAAQLSELKTMVRNVLDRFKEEVSPVLRQ